MTSHDITSTPSATGCDSESDREAAHDRAYKILMHREQRSKYYTKNRDRERAKALERAKRRTLTESSDPQLIEARKKRHREVQARYYAKRRDAELQRRAAFALSLLAPVEESEECDTDDEQEHGDM